MSPFPHRKKNVTISVRCGARCRAYYASSMGEGKGPPHNCAPARFLFFGLFPIPGVFPLSIRNSRLVQAGSPGPAEPSAPLLASPSPQSLLPPSGHANLARIFPVRRRLCWRRPPRKDLFLRPDVVPHPLQTLVPPSGGTTSLGPNGLSSGRTWCLIPRKPLFLRPEAPRP